MSGNNRQIEDDFIQASQDIAAGRSLDQTLSDHPDHAAQIEPMLGLVEDIKDVPHPILSSDALARIGSRAQLAARQRQRSMSASPSPAQPRPFSIVRSTPGTHEPSPLPPTRVAGILRFNTKVALVASLAVLLIVGTIVAGILLFNNSPGKSQQLESYAGTITAIEPGKWLMSDNTEVLVDNLTEIHGQPIVGAKMTCLAERLDGNEGNERYRALEIWVLGDSNSPQEPSGQHDTLLISRGLGHT